MLNMTRYVPTLCAVTLVAFLACTAPGQTSTGSISGTVADQNHAVIPGATVTIRNTATGYTRSTTTESEGRYSFSDVPIGSYEITVEATTFSTYVWTGIKLLVNQHADVSPELKLRTVEE